MVLSFRGIYGSKVVIEEDMGVRHKPQPVE